MSNKNIFKSLSLASALVLTVSVTHADQHDKSGDLNNHLCKDLMRMDGSDRDISMGFYHGYMLGKKSTTKFEADKLSGITDEIIEYCLDNPNVKALDAFAKYTK